MNFHDISQLKAIDETERARYYPTVMRHLRSRYSQGRYLCAFALIAAVLLVGIQTPADDEAPLTDDQLLRHIQQNAFGYFLNETGDTGLIRDRMTQPNISSTMAAGFQLTAYCIAAENNWITRDEAAALVLKTLRTYSKLPRFHGMWGHYYDINLGQVVPWMHPNDDGADVSETGFMMAGMLTCRNYFDGTTDEEKQIRALATVLYEGVEWDWMLQDAEGNTRKTLAWHWSPKHGFKVGQEQRVAADLEISSMITYILAIASPTHPIPADCWDDGWAARYQWGTHGKHTFITRPALFNHQYAQLWLDARNRTDRHADYFRNSTYATLANRAYCLKTLYPKQDIWGLTYCDGPFGYGTYGYPPKQGNIDEEATIAPTGPAGSIAFTPSESTSALRYMYERYKETLWGKYGFRDAFSPRHEWVSSDYIAIDQGPIVMMIENHLSGLVWNTFMGDRDVRKALDQIGLVGVIDDFEPVRDVPPYAEWDVVNGRDRYSTGYSKSPSKSGRRSLHVSFNNKGAFDGYVMGRTAMNDMRAFSYLSAWVSGDVEPAIRLQDAHGNTRILKKEGSAPGIDGWTHLVYRMPTDSGVHVDRIVGIHLIAGLPDERGSFNIDDIRLTNEQDLIPPAEPRTLMARPTESPGEVELRWLPGDEKDLPYKYIIRRARKPFTSEKSFANGIPVIEGPGARISGTNLSFTVGGLDMGKKHYFAVRAVDAADNISELTVSREIKLPKYQAPDLVVLENFEDFQLEDPAGRWHASSANVELGIARKRVHDGEQALKIIYKKSGENDRWAYVGTDLKYRDFSRHRYLKMSVRGKGDILAKLWNNVDRQEDLTGEIGLAADDWRELTFDLSQCKTVDLTRVPKLLIFVEPGETDVDGRIIIDSIQLTN